jgi:hypothetical protein
MYDRNAINGEDSLELERRPPKHAGSVISLRLNEKTEAAEFADFLFLSHRISLTYKEEVSGFR